MLLRRLIYNYMVSHSTQQVLDKPLSQSIEHIANRTFLDFIENVVLADYVDAISVIIMMASYALHVRIDVVIVGLTDTETVTLVG